MAQTTTSATPAVNTPDTEEVETEAPEVEVVVTEVTVEVTYRPAEGSAGL